LSVELAPPLMGQLADLRVAVSIWLYDPQFDPSTIG
jgi:hypothetical protein